MYMNRNEIIISLVLVLIVLYLINYKKENFDDIHYYDLPFDERPKEIIKEEPNAFSILYNKVTKTYDNISKKISDKINLNDMKKMFTPQVDYNKLKQNITTKTEEYDKKIKKYMNDNKNEIDEMPLFNQDYRTESNLNYTNDLDKTINRIKDQSDDLDLNHSSSLNKQFSIMETMDNHLEEEPYKKSDTFIYENIPESTNNPNEKLNHPAAFSGYYNNSQLMQNTEPSNITIEGQFNSPYTSDTDNLVTNELRYKMKHLIKAGVFKDYEHQDRTESLQAAEEYMAYQQLQDNMRDLRTGNVKDGTLRETYNDMVYDYKNINK